MSIHFYMHAQLTQDHGRSWAYIGWQSWACTSPVWGQDPVLAGRRHLPKKILKNKPFLTNRTDQALYPVVIFLKSADFAILNFSWKDFSKLLLRFVDLVRVAHGGWFKLISAWLIPSISPTSHCEGTRSSQVLLMS